MKKLLIYSCLMFSSLNVFGINLDQNISEPVYSKKIEKVEGDSAQAIYLSLPVKAELKFSSWIKNYKNISCSAHPNWGSTSYECIIFEKEI